MTCKIIQFPLTEEIIQRQIHQELLDRGFAYNNITQKAFDSFITEMAKVVTDRDPLIKKANDRHEKTNQIMAWVYQFESLSYIDYTPTIRKPDLTLVK